MANRKPADFDKLIPQDLGPVAPQKFPWVACPILPSATGWPKGTKAVANLPDRVPIAQITLPDGTLYRFEKIDGGSYELFKKSPVGAGWSLECEGERKDAISWAKDLRARGGTHPFKSVTQLVARSFPVVLELDSWPTTITEGGPGHSYNVQAEIILEARSHADDQLELTGLIKERGFGWCDQFVEFSVDIETPLTEASITGIRDSFVEGGLPWIATPLVNNPARSLERLFGHFPWLA